MKRNDLWKNINNDSKVFDTFINLYVRWLDEKDYEDINDYLQVIKKHIPSAYKISKKPFGVTCKCEDGDMKIFIKRKGNSVSIMGQLV